jgi:hypothetical protein
LFTFTALIVFPVPVKTRFYCFNLQLLSNRFSTFIVTLIVYSLFSHHATAKGIDLGTWHILNVKYRPNKKLNYFAESQLRSLKFYEQFHYYEFKGGINYKINNNTQITLGAGNYQTYKEGGNFETPKNNNEFRLWPQITFSQDIGKLNLEHRYRAELRWTSNGYRNRFRYRLAVAYPFGKPIKGFKPYQIGISNELFLTDKSPFFERNRSQINFIYKSSKAHSYQIGYIHQFDYKLNDETGRDVFVLGYY